MKTNINKHYLVLLGNEIKSLRQKNGFSQEDLSFKCDLHRTYIGAVERGERNITILNLIKIASALNVHVSEVLNFNIDNKGEKNEKMKKN